jgi:hypothetical protein
VDERLVEIIKQVSDEKGAELVEVGTMPDHVHLLVGIDPQFGINKLVKLIKGRSSRLLRQEFPSLRRRAQLEAVSLMGQHLRCRLGLGRRQRRLRPPFGRTAAVETGAEAGERLHHVAHQVVCDLGALDHDQVASLCMSSDPTTKTYVARRTAEGKSKKEITRCLKRHVAREMSKLLTRHHPALGSWLLLHPTTLSLLRLPAG